MVMGIIRLILALEVLIYHLPNNSYFDYIGMNGSIIVNGFFIISGFFIALVINEKYFKKEGKSYFLFITNRFLKLYPAYFITLIFAIIVSIIGFLIINNWIFLQSYFDQNLNIYSLLIFCFANISMIGINTISFFSVNPITGQLFFTGTPESNAINFIFITQAWAVSIELIFYFIAPFILRKKISILVGLLVSSFFLRVLLYYFGFSDNPWRDRFFPTELVFFMLGAVVYKIYKVYNLKNFINSGNVLLYIVPLINIAFIFFYQYFPDKTFLYFSIKEWIFYGLLTISLPIMFLLSNNMKKIDRFTAELSYPIFLSQVVILNLVAIFINFNVHDNIAKTLTIILTVLFSLIITKCLMNPIEKIRQKRIEKTRLDKK